MSSILQLPQEILCLICQYLTTKDKHSLYYTCSTLRDVATTRVVNKNIILSLTTLATSESFKLNYIKDVSEYIEKLDLSGVRDLTKTNLIPALNRMKNLKNLNVAYTNIIIPDLIDGKLRTNIKTLTINFSFTKENSEINIPNTTLKAIQDFFEEIDNVHFVGSVENLLYSKLPSYVLRKSNKELLAEFTIIRNFNGPIYAHVDDMDNIGSFTFKYLSICFPILTDREDAFYDSLVPQFVNFNLFKLQNLEYILILNGNIHLMYVSERFKSFVSKHFHIVAESISDLRYLEFKYNSLFWFWNKDCTSFDEAFYDNLLLKMKDLYPNYIRYFEYNAPVLIRNNNSKWFHIKPLVLKTYKSLSLPDSAPPPNKIQRLGSESFLLDYDNVLQTDTNVKLKFNFGPTVLHFTLSPGLNYLKKITVLSIVGHYLCSQDFFQILFDKCTNLCTLNIGYSPKCSCSKPVARSIHLSNSIKNVRIVDNTVDFNVLFEAFTKLKGLENIYIADRSYINDYTFPTNDLIPVITQCENLYSLFIHKVISDSMKVNVLRFVAKVRHSLNRSYLRVDINNDKDSPFETEGINPFLMFLR